MKPSRYIWMAGQAAAVCALSYMMISQGGELEQRPVLVFLMNTAIVAFATAVLSYAIDRLRYSPRRVAMWLVAVLLSAFALSGVIFLGGNRTMAFQHLFLIVLLVVAIASPFAVSIFRSLSPKHRKPGSEHERLGAGRSSVGERLEQKRGLGVGEDPR